jgi:CDP-diacylglycerol--glycerol-3-phosphate 3-phosphatidyltransferase
MRPTLPNLLTMFRLGAAPLLALVFVAMPHPWSDAVALVLFVGAALTDWLDGFLARRWGQVSRFGAMLDPIADKAMVIIAVAVLFGLFDMDPLVVLPAAVILFREVFVSGLREFLGDTAGTLAVTKLAKWKTTVQMVAVSVLLAYGIAAHGFGMAVMGMDPEVAGAVLAGDAPDEVGLNRWWGAASALYALGLALLWTAAILTALTGWDYFRKAMPHLKDPA